MPYEFLRGIVDRRVAIELDSGKGVLRIREHAPGLRFGHPPVTGPGTRGASRRRWKPQLETDQRRRSAIATCRDDSLAPIRGTRNGPRRSPRVTRHVRAATLSPTTRRLCTCRPTARASRAATDHRTVSGAFSVDNRPRLVVEPTQSRHTTRSDRLHANAHDSSLRRALESRGVERTLLLSAAFHRPVPPARREDTD